MKIVLRKPALIAVLVTAVFAAGCGDDGGNGKGNGNGKNKGKSVEENVKTAQGIASSCDQPTVSDSYIGFKVGKPDDWALDSTGGTVVVKKDAKGGELALFYPVVLNSGMSLKSFYDTYSGILNKTAEADGGGLNFKITEEESKLITADIDGSFAGKEIKGRAEAVNDGQQSVFKTYWAPESDFGDEEETLSEIVGCYEKEQGTLFVSHNGSYFSASYPEGWKVTGETQNGIDIAAPNDEGSVNFAYVTGVPGVSTPEEFRDWTFQQFGVENVQITATQSLGDITDQTGTSWSTKASEFNADYKGDAIHGVITTAIGSGYGSFTGVVSVRAAKESSWDELAGALAATQESVKIIAAPSGSGSGASSSGPSLPANQPNENPLISSGEYRDQVNDKVSQDWQEATMGFDNVESPTTGDQYQAPLNSYDPTGNDGPGYYRSLPDGSSEKLVETPP